LAPIIAFLGCDPIIETPVAIPEMISALRPRRGVTANELGKLLGVYKLTIRAWEAGVQPAAGSAVFNVFATSSRTVLRARAKGIGKDDIRIGEIHALQHLAHRGRGRSLLVGGKRGEHFAKAQYRDIVLCRCTRRTRMEAV